MFQIIDWIARNVILNAIVVLVLVDYYAKLVLIINQGILVLIYALMELILKGIYAKN